MACGKRRAVWKRDPGVRACMCFWRLTSVGGGKREGRGDRVPQCPGCGAGKTQFLATLLSLLGKPQCCGRGGAGGEQQICWTDSALEGGTGSLEMTQFLLRAVMHTLCDWRRIYAFQIWSSSWGKHGPHQLGHSWIQCPQPTLGPSRSRDNSIDGRTRDCVEMPSPQGREVLTQSLWGPWALATSEICFCLLVA